MKTEKFVQRPGCLDVQLDVYFGFNNLEQGTKERKIKVNGKFVQRPYSGRPAEHLQTTQRNFNHVVATLTVVPLYDPVPW